MRAPIVQSIAPQVWRMRPPVRCFATSRPALRRLHLAYSLWEPKSGNTEGAPILFLHGLFGNKRNNQSISKILAKDLKRPVYALDLRNHGESPHDPTHTYDAMSEDVVRFIRECGLEKPCIIGHSMGAKTAMTLALAHPHLPSSVVAVDNAPVDAALKNDFANYVRGMQKVADARVGSQREAGAILEEFTESKDVLQFLLTNLAKPAGAKHYEWRIPVKTLGMALDHMADFPFKDPDAARFDGPALFVRGTKSHYVPDETLPTIGRFFPRFRLADVEAGHWVVSENPEAFRRVVVDFLESKD